MKYKVVYYSGIVRAFYKPKIAEVELSSSDKANEATFKTKIGLSDNAVVLSWSLIEED